MNQYLNVRRLNFAKKQIEEFKKLSLDVMFSHLKCEHNSQDYQIQMSQTMEGTTINIKPKGSRPDQQEKVEQVKATSNPLSGQKEDYQNPEGVVQEKKEDETKRSLLQLWGQLTNLKKGMFIGGVVLFLILITLIVLLIVALSIKPKFVVRKTADMSIPTTNQRLQTYEIQATKDNLITPKKNANFSMSTVTQTAKARLLQQGDGSSETAAVVLEFNYPKQGVTLLATSAEDIIVHVDYDRMIASYTDRRLLFAAEMAATLRNMQETQSIKENGLAFDDSASIIRDAETSLLRAVASVSYLDPSQLALQYSETVAIVKQPDGTYVPQIQVQSSRLLWALSRLRGLQQWESVFDEINDAVLIPKIQSAQAVIAEFIVDPDAVANSPQLTAVLRGSNFNQNVDIDVVSEEQVPTTSRLLQDSSATIPTTTTPTTPDTPTAPDTTTTPTAPISTITVPNNGSTSNPTTNSAGNQKVKNNTKKYEKKRYYKPIAPRKSRTRQRGNKSRNISKNSYESAINCTGPSDTKICNTKVLNDNTSPYKINRNKTKVVKAKIRPRHTVYVKNKKKPVDTKITPPAQPNKNLNTEPENKKQAPQSTATPAPVVAKPEAPSNPAPSGSIEAPAPSNPSSTTPSVSTLNSEPMATNP